MAPTFAKLPAFRRQKESKGARQRSLPLVGRVRVGVHFRKTPNAIAFPLEGIGYAAIGLVMTCHMRFLWMVAVRNSGCKSPFHGIRGKAKR